MENPIWADVADRTLFIFVVGGFINRWSITSIAAMTGSREDTISKYIRVIKNAIHTVIVEELPTFVLGGVGERVQIDESHVFTRKNNVGRVLATTTDGWVFGIIEDKPEGKLFLQMVEFRDSVTLETIIEKTDQKGDDCVFGLLASVLKPQKTWVQT